MEKFNATCKYGFTNKPEDLGKLIGNALSDYRPDTIDQLRAEVSKLQDALAGLLVVLYANGNSRVEARLGLSAEQLNDILPGAGIGEITPA